MSDTFMDKFNAIGERIKEGGADLGRKMSAGMSSMGERVKDLFQTTPAMTDADILIEDATSDTLQIDGPDWNKNLQICDSINHGPNPSLGLEVVRALKKRLNLNPRNPAVQMLSLHLLEACVKNCEKMFSEVASERMLDEMVKLVDDPLTAPAVRAKALSLIESWGDAVDELRYLPVFEETYKSLKSRGVQFPGRDTEDLAPIFTPPSIFASETDLIPGVVDVPELPVTARYTQEQSKEILDVATNSVELLSTVLSSSPPHEVLKEELTSTLVEHCRQSQSNVQRFIEAGTDDEKLLFEALNVNDELQRVINRFEELCATSTVVSNHSSEPALIPVEVMDEEEEEEEDVLIRKTGISESALVTKSGTKPTSITMAHDSKGEEAAMADFDKMIFGPSGAPSYENHQDTTKTNGKDLIDL